MRGTQARRRSARGLVTLLGAVGVFGIAFAVCGFAADAPADQTDRALVQQGRDLFLREWLPNDARSHGGDGLGPAFNDSSCVACQNAGGPGGGGPESKNVDILSAVPIPGMVPGPQGGMAPRPPGFLERAFQALLGVDVGDVVGEEAKVSVPPGAPPRIDRSPLVALHPGFRSANSIVLHRFATEPGYEAWRTRTLGVGFFGDPSQGFSDDQRAEMEIQALRFQVQNDAQRQNQVQAGSFFVLRSQRNPTALFGSGALDSIADDALLAQAAAKQADYPEIRGRVSRLKDGRIGKFGWKAQTPSLEDFVLTACAVELGLEVPGHSQGGLPQKPEAKAPGLDLTAEECRALTEYVRLLPKPTTTNADDAEVVAGRALFASTGCASCHTPKLGAADGIYADLLLHDMGQDLGDVGQYGVFDPSSPEAPIDPEDGDEMVQAAPAAVPTPVQAIAVAPERFASITSIPGPPPVEVQAAPDGLATIPEPPQAPSAPGVVTTFTSPAPMAANFFMQSAGGVSPIRPKDGPASRQEWRTPPLWGLRDSAPYLHDGRARTIEQAIALHDGEANRVTRKYFALKPAERMQLLDFLRSLAAPESQTVAQANP